MPKLGQKTPIEKRFWIKVERNNKSDCWPWTGVRIPGGYGQIWFKERMQGAHRVAFFLTSGWMPPVVMHICDNRPCCNPNHLQAGDTKTNALDCVLKGRQTRHERHWKSKLTIKAVKIIREKTKSSKELARLFGVCIGTINYVRNGTTWKGI